MPTANLTWTNQSTGDSPDTTRVERSEGYPFGHPQSSPTTIADAATGGLDPTSANGSYSDSTIEGDKFYSFRISTVKGSEVASGVPTPLEYVHDQINDLGYPGGTPSSVQTYNISTAPFFHLDMQRSNTGYTPSQTTLMTEGYGGIERMDTEAIDPISTTYTNAPYFWEFDLNPGGTANNKKFMARAWGSWAQYVVKPSQTTPDGDVNCPDGLTAFVVTTTAHMGNFPLSDNRTGYGAMAGSGAYPWPSDASASNFSMMGSANKGISWTHSGPSVGYNNLNTGSQQTLHVCAFRINNDATAFATGTIRGQAFDGGNLIGTTDNMHAKSYHNGNPPGTNGTDHRGAACFNSTYSMTLLAAPTSQEMLMAEVLYFDSALNLSDMNDVNAYLCNKYSIVPTTISSSDLIN